MLIDEQIIFRRFTVGGYPINGYLVADRKTGIGVFIDPGGFGQEIAAFIAGKKIDLRHVFFTHGHWDHTEGIGEIQKKYSVKCYAGKNEVRAASTVLSGGEKIEVGQLTFRALATPGHTPGGISYHCRNAVFTGDALFCGSVGGTSRAADAKLQIEKVREHIFSLSDETLVFPAHGPITTVAAEKYANPFFK